MNRKLTALGIAFVLTCASHSAGAETVNQQQVKSLQEISDFIKANCNSPPIEGSGSSLRLNAEGNAQLSNLWKAVAQVQGKAGVDAKYEQYKGVIQSDLAKALASSNDCSRNAQNLLVPLMVPGLSGQSALPSSMLEGGTPPSPQKVVNSRTTGLLERDIPISDIAGWRLPPASFPRAVHFDLRIEGQAEDLESRTSLMTLLQDGQQVCSYRFDIGNNKVGKVAALKRCDQDVAADEGHIYTVTVQPASKFVSVTMNASAQRPR
ncbi:exported hypothetical protein [Burkholderia sp. 8Y]|uniref:hypothetical protein n=1 Tax=Burkholderia sp. 8Y TaxID=2653133 RepID=UPI0012F20FF6|nr:hypothetical protein [Burkholderia sp. 8Y]VXC83008.1 exported hypothetical protein [Burkholderia sp. 8Y]